MSNVLVAAGMTEDQIIALAQTPSLFIGDGGNWQLNTGSAGILSAGSTPAPALTEDQAALVQDAIDKSNEAARTTPQAVTDGHGLITSDEAKDDIKTTLGGIFDDINLINKIGDDAVAMQKGGGASIHPWGWHAYFDEDATKALVDLLEVEITKVGLVTAAFAAAIPVLAAVGGILTIVGEGLGQLVKNRDQGNGVDIKGWLWVIPYVTPYKPKK